jgi:hypothetical protein
VAAAPTPTVLRKVRRDTWNELGGFSGGRFGIIDLAGGRIPPDPDVWWGTAVVGRYSRDRGRMLGSAAWELQSSGLPVLSRARCGKAGRPDFSVSATGIGVVARWSG